MPGSTPQEQGSEQPALPRRNSHSMREPEAPKPCHQCKPIQTSMYTAACTQGLAMLDASWALYVNRYLCFPLESLNTFCLCGSPYTEVRDGEAQQHSLSHLHEPSSRCYDVVVSLQMLRDSPIIGWTLGQAKCRQEDCQEATATTVQGRSPR